MACLNSNCTSTKEYNTCHMGSAQAQLDITMTIFLFIGLALLALVQNKVSAELDESRQSAQDYSIVVDDPGDDDINCDEWQRFFGQFGHVTFVTVAFNNGDLLKLLAERRVIKNELAMEIGNANNPEQMALLEDRRNAMDAKKQNIRKMIVKAGAFGLQDPEKLNIRLEKVPRRCRT